MKTETLILKYGKCSWGRCIFCGYGKIRGASAPADSVIADFKRFFDNLEEDVNQVKVFGSGSFLDEKQIPKDARNYFFSECKKKSIDLIIESRPEFIKDDDDFHGLNFTVAIGLEVADDRVLDKIKKGFHLRDFEKAEKIIRDKGGKVRTYLIVNLPFKNDLNASVDYALKHSDSLVLINLLPHGNTEIFRLWLSGEWNFLTVEEFEKITGKFRNNPKIEFDAETFRFVPKFPDELKENLSGVGEEFLTHPHFDVWQNYLCSWFKPKQEVVLFLPCSHKKPYSESETHKNIIEILDRLGVYKKIHQVMLSNAGVIPREFEGSYPFADYDWDEKLETPEIKARYIEVTKNRIKKYLKSKNYKKIYCFLKYSSESYIALEHACSELNLNFGNLLSKETYDKIRDEKKILQRDESLNDLECGLKKIEFE